MRRNRGYEPLLWIDDNPVGHAVTSCSFVPQTIQEPQFHGGFREFLTGWVMELEAFQSLDDGSLWREMWSRPGQEVAFRYAAHGNDAPSLTSPHLVGTVRFGARPQFGGNASLRSSHSFSSTLSIVTGPELVTA